MGGSRGGGGPAVQTPPGIPRLLIFAMLNVLVRPLLGPPEKIFWICSPYMLVGDFNGHNVLWGCNGNDPRGELIEDFITKNDICLMNDKSNTYLDSSKGTFSSLDLHSVTPLYLDSGLFVKINMDLTTFPFLIESVQTHDEAHNPK